MRHRPGNFDEALGKLEDAFPIGKPFFTYQADEVLGGPGRATPVLLYALEVGLFCPEAIQLQRPTGRGRGWVFVEPEIEGDPNG